MERYSASGYPGQRYVQHRQGRGRAGRQWLLQQIDATERAAAGPLETDGGQYSVTQRENSLALFVHGDAVVA
jgi:hypothetical protein